MSTLKPQNTRALARGAIIAALYTALTSHISRRASGAYSFARATPPIPLSSSMM